MHCAKDIISAIFIMAASPFALKILPAWCRLAASHCTTLTGASTTIVHYLKSAKYLSFAVSGLGIIKGLEGQFKDFGAGGF